MKWVKFAAKIFQLDVWESRCCDSFITDSDPTFPSLLRLWMACVIYAVTLCATGVAGPQMVTFMHWLLKSELDKLSSLTVSESISIQYKERSKKGIVKEDSIACNFT